MCSPRPNVCVRVRTLELYEAIFANEAVRRSSACRDGGVRDKADLLAVVWNNHFRGKAVANAVQTKARLSGDKVDVPELLAGTYPELEPIARPPKGSLF